MSIDIWFQANCQIDIYFLTYLYFERFWRPWYRSKYLKMSPLIWWFPIEKYLLCDLYFQKFRACGAPYCAIFLKRIVTIEVVVFFSRLRRPFRYYRHLLINTLQEFLMTWNQRSMCARLVTISAIFRAEGAKNIGHFERTFLTYILGLDIYFLALSQIDIYFLTYIFRANLLLWGESPVKLH